jgi:demethylmenaquinone methyltransferase/2-methoxy-6-polyprenyl-1,4-benzoquinol methylase
MSNDQEHLDAPRLRASIGSYYADPVRRLSFVRDLFNRTAQHYDSANRLFSLGSGAWYRRSCLRWAGLRPGLQVVDVAIGTGLLAREAIAITADRRGVIGVDVSEAMLEIARDKLGILLVQGAAEALPLASATVDFVTMGYALRHIADLDAALREALRVLRPGGRIVLLEISAPRKKLGRALASAYIGGIVPFLALLMARDRRARMLMRYHWETIMAYLPPETVMRTLADCGFHNVDCWMELDLFQCYVASKAPACQSRGDDPQRA